MRRTDARRRKRDRPEAVTHGFHVSAYKVDPRVSVFACNLLSKNFCRASLSDEVVEGGPEVPLVIKPSAFACRAERLARTGTCPNRSIIWPACEPKGVGPDSNTCKEMALCVSVKVARSNIFNTPVVNIARRDVACGDQVAQPLGCIFVEFVVVRQFHCATSTAVTAWECCTHSRNSYRPMLARNRSVMAADCTASVCTPSGFTLWGS